MTVNEKLKFYRELKGLSRTELGEIIGLSADRIQKYENGARTPKHGLLCKFANALDINVKKLEVSFSNDQLFEVLYDLKYFYGIDYKCPIANSHIGEYNDKRK